MILREKGGAVARNVNAIILPGPGEGDEVFRLNPLTVVNARQLRQARAGGGQHVSIRPGVPVPALRNFVAVFTL